MYKSLFSNQLEDDEAENTADTKEAADQVKSEYAFEGYTIELNEKIMLTPITLSVKK